MSQKIKDWLVITYTIMIFKLSENKIDTKMPEMFKNILSPYSLPERKQHKVVWVPFT